MRAHIIRTVLVMLVAIAMHSPALAQTAAEAPQVTMTRLPGGRGVVEVADATVRIRKEFAAGVSTATLKAGGDELTLTVSGGRLEVSNGKGSASITDGSVDDVAQLMALLQGSRAAAGGRALLRRLGTERTPANQLLLMTRAVLELAEGNTESVLIHRQWARAEKARLTRPKTMAGVTRVSLQSGGGDRGPGDCWDIYSKEAIRIADDYVQCLEGVPWWNVVRSTGCALVYTVRAEGAMWWFISCSGGFPFQG